MFSGKNLYNGSNARNYLRSHKNYLMGGDSSGGNGWRLYSPWRVT